MQALWEPNLNHIYTFTNAIQIICLQRLKLDHILAQGNICIADLQGYINDATFLMKSLSALSSLASEPKCYVLLYIVLLHKIFFKIDLTHPFNNPLN